MFNMGRALIAALTIILVPFTSYAASDENRRTIQNITNEFLEEYDLPPTQVIFVSDVTQLEGSHAEAMAVTQCLIGRRSGRLRCEIYYDTCVLELGTNVMRNLAAHEAAHYVNAHINNKFDHGRQWARILRNENWRVVEEYGDGITEECS